MIAFKHSRGDVPCFRIAFWYDTSYMPKFEDKNASHSEHGIRGIDVCYCAHCGKFINPRTELVGDPYICGKRTGERKS